MPRCVQTYQLNDAEKNYPTHEKELLAIIKALKKWRSHLLGARFEIYMDHRTLEYFQSQKEMSRRQMRWSMYLADFDYTITYIHGESNTAADALSRMPDTTPDACLTACAMAYTRHAPTPPAAGILNITQLASKQITLGKSWKYGEKNTANFFLVARIILGEN